MELSRRYSNHADQASTLLRTLRLASAQPALAAKTSVAVSSGPNRRSSGRAELNPCTGATAYLAGSTLDELALHHEVSTSTIKRVVRGSGTRKYWRTSEGDSGCSTASSSDAAGAAATAVPPDESGT